MKLIHVHDKPFAMPVAADAGAACEVTEGGGIEVYLSCIARGLMDRGHEIVEVRFGEASAGASEPRRYRAVSSSVVPRQATFEAVEAMIRAEKPDLIHLHSAYYAVHPMLLARLRRLCPLVLTQHDVTPFCLNGTKLRRDAALCRARIGVGCVTTGCHRSRSTAGAAQDAVRAMFAAAKLGAMRKVPVLVVPSRYLREQALLHGFDGDQVRVLSQFSEYPASAGSPVPAAKRILFVGRLVPEKGSAVLLDALARLQTQGWEAAIAGEGPLLDTLRARAETLTGRVRFLGPVSRRDLPEHFAGSNVVVVPSLIPESFGLVGVEAMSFGRPVVAFRAGGIDEWLTPGETGLFARHGDPDDLAAQIDRLLGDRALQDRMGARGRAEVGARFQLATHLDCLEGIYADARRCFSVH